MNGRDAAACLLAALTVMSVAGTVLAVREWRRMPGLGDLAVYLLGPSVAGVACSVAGWAWWVIR